MHMKLLYSPTSPYVRLVLAAAHELGLADKIDTVPVDHLAETPDPALAAANPVLKIPALILENGTALFDSRVIVEYLAWLAEDKRLFPPEVPERWTVARRFALVQGIMDAVVLIVYEKRLRPESAYHQPWVDRQFTKLRSGLDALEAEAETFPIQPSIAELALGCALGFIDYRLPLEDWRSSRPDLAEWFTGIAERPSMAATRPPPL